MGCGGFTAGWIEAPSAEPCSNRGAQAQYKHWLSRHITVLANSRSGFFQAIGIQPDPPDAT
jgi:hypothetical protein